MNLPRYVPRVGDLVRVPSLVASAILRLPSDANIERAVFEVVSVEPLQLTHTCEPPLGVTQDSVSPVHPPNWREAKLAYGMRVRVNSHNYESNGVVGYVGEPRHLMGPFMYQVFSETEREQFLGCWRPEYLICIGAKAAA